MTKRRPVPKLPASSPHPDLVKTKDGYAVAGSEKAKAASSPSRGLIKTVPPESWLPHPRLGARLKRDLARISEQGVPTDIRSILNSFHRFIAPFFATDGDTHFPCPVTRHALDPKLSSKGGLGHVLLFYICDAALGYFAFVKGEGTQEHYDAIEKVHYIASEGVMGFNVVGDEQNGFGFTKKYDGDKNDGLL